MSERAKSGGIALLRRSTDKQEASLEIQLDWATEKYKEMGIRCDASRADLQHMVTKKLSEYRDLYIDDAISGSDLQRPGLQLMIRRIERDKSVSHAAIYKSDRFARPENPLEAVVLENSICMMGATIIFSDRIALPRRRGTNNLPDDVLKLFQYGQAGEEVNKLSDRVIFGQSKVAREGASAGGRAAYGFKRVLVRASDNAIIQDLADGTKIRQPGCVVKHVVGDPSKIAIWQEILKLYETGNGAREIATYLNERGIPSPDAGRSRRDGEVLRMVSGKWTAGTILALIRNRSIIAESSYGVQSEGRLRRFSPKGPRLLSEGDWREDSKPKVIRNDESIVIRAKTGFDPNVETALFESCQKQLEKRGKSQRGISRRKDPARYPLAMRIFDATDRCGHPMYAKTSGNRPLYLCSRYMKTCGRECGHNAVDGEAALRFTLNFLREAVDRVGGRIALRKQLNKLADRDGSVPDTKNRASEVAMLHSKLAGAKAELAMIQRNLARAASDEAYAAVAGEFERQRIEIANLEQKVEKASAAAKHSPSNSIEANVGAALKLYDQLELLTRSPDARKAIRDLLKKINFRLWLNFANANKGRRNVRVLLGGIVTTGDAPDPVARYGQGDDHYQDHEGVGVLPMPVGEISPSDSNSHQEGVSLRMVNRGDKI